MNPNLKTAVYVRKGNNIRNIGADTNQNFASNNLAKKESRRLQKRLGDGTVRKA